MSKTFDHYYGREDNKVWGRVFRCRHEGPFTLQAEEVASGRFATLEEIMHLRHQEPFTPDGIEILHRIFTSP